MGRSKNGLFNLSRLYAPNRRIAPDDLYASKEFAILYPNLTDCETPDKKPAPGCGRRERQAFTFEKPNCRSQISKTCSLTVVVSVPVAAKTFVMTSIVSLMPSGIVTFVAFVL